MGNRIALLILPWLLAAAPVGTGAGKVFLSKEEALELAFLDLDVERVTRYLTEPERERVDELAKVDVDQGVVHAYVARNKQGELVGTAYFDVHRVRTKKEVVMFVITPQDTIARFEVLAFAEPLDYLPRDKWYAQLLGRKLDDELSLKRGIKGVTGATLTARATTEAARRVLALHAVLGERESRTSESR